ncbi:MAG TPA: PD-(D/E)XK nuclease family protein [Vicinamibacterales bacterium]
MITPRQTTLIRAAGLRAFQRAIAAAIPPEPSARSSSRAAVIVPTKAAGDLLRRTLGREPLADVVTRDGFYARLHSHFTLPALTAFEREVLLRQAARAAAAAEPPPFRLRPGLIIQMLAFYDELHRRGRTLDAFERLMVDALEPSADIDRGAARMLAQTRFLVRAFRGYQANAESTGRLDEHGLRPLILKDAEPRSFTHVVVTVGDRAADPHGLWSVDFDLLTRLPGLARLDVVATERTLASGFEARVHDLLPGIEERSEATSGGEPVLSIPSNGGRRFFVARDREEELAEVARVVKHRARSGSLPDSTRFAVVFQRPLPYVYLARHVFADARIAWQATDELPLAAEPFAAALDLVLTFLVSGFTRAAGVALLRSPHLRVTLDQEPYDRRDVAALERALIERRFVGGIEVLETWVAQARGAPARSGRAMLAAARALAPIGEADSASRQIAILAAFLRERGHPSSEHDTPLARDHHARETILGALDALAAAHAAHDDGPLELDELGGTIRRWIESQTVPVGCGTKGVQLVDPSAARYGDFDEIRIVGLVEADWPDSPGRNIFYPASLLNQLGWLPDSERLAGARAAFRDLIRLPAVRCSASAFTLEDDAVVSASSFTEELEVPDLAIERTEIGAQRIFIHEALTRDPVSSDVLGASAAEWLAVRRSRTTASDRRFRGFTGPQISDGYAVNAVEQYVACPFKYFATTVLDLEEEKEDEPGLTPLERGLFVHEVLCEFFSKWQEAGHGAITPDNLQAAIDTFTEIAEKRLATLPATERALERTHLLGSAAASGLAGRAFAFELERPAPVVERLLEHRLEGTFTFASGDRKRAVRIRGKADRIDILPGQSIRVIDYKLRRAPNPKRAIQLPVYAVASAQSLAATRGGVWRLAEAGYVAFAERQGFVRLGGRQGDTSKLADAVAAGQALFLDAIDGIERGEFPVRPEEPYRCRFCAYPSVCRKDYVGDE